MMTRGWVLNAPVSAIVVTASTATPVVMGWPDCVVNTGVDFIAQLEDEVDVRSKRHTWPCRSPA